MRQNIAHLHDNKERIKQFLLMSLEHVNGKWRVRHTVSSMRTFGVIYHIPQVPPSGAAAGGCYKLYGDGWDAWKGLIAKGVVADGWWRLVVVFSEHWRSSRETKHMLGHSVKWASLLNNIHPLVLSLNAFLCLSSWNVFLSVSVSLPR